MKIKNLLTQVTAFAVCISSAVVASAGPVGKSSKNIFEGLLKAPRLSRGQVQHYVFPKQTATRIAAQASSLDRQIHAADAAQRAATVAPKHAPARTPVVLGHSPEDIAFSLRSIVAASSLEKDVLIYNEKEQAFYQPEITAARNLLTALDSVEHLGDKETLALGSAILQNLKNHALQTYLLEALLNKQIHVMRKDLTEYFCFDQSFEVCALRYTVRHPRQQVLMMRRLLHNPLIDEEVKARVRAFLAEPAITLEDSPQFFKALSQLHAQYNQRMLAAQESEIIQMQVAYYAKLTDRLNAFLQRKGRIPKWNTTDPEEILLFEELEWVKLNQKNNLFEPITSYQNAIQQTLRNAEPAYLTQEKTVALFEQFVRETHRIYPRSLRDQLKEGEIPFAREEELWDNLSYWRIRDASINGKMTEIYQKYL